MGLVPESAASLPDGLRTIVLLGPDGPGFWPQFTGSPEYLDNAPDPLDRWSTRVIGQMAEAFGARALFPFGATPPHPFVTWALASGRAFASPVHLLVHDKAGLWVSYRGALGLTEPLAPEPAAVHPCTDCSKPCLSACPVDALTQAGYDLDACHGFLDRPEGAGCYSNGCAVRAACPVSRAYGRDAAQSAHHMGYFHP
ncbi:MAG: ferredoxin [Rhodobacteraceae bacterium]|nr:MAG: ferredoxin [Paracoccaceae bacterium]